ncbi:putative endonuclease [Desulfocicer vacuolatum DSM 3385]|uniref:Putative endonuclease n=1 Tax=Desulfocicer vacuolatum DSM 3385 TaxID=1121400 RepID=A0A1W2BQY8_9BACT|nr:GIY-YIG nuclease family protein [Desulfocicer vacuolatum]SMC75339.1 putative endonuclease [Desulfocicer vacuolatum DSM 3385]
MKNWQVYLVRCSDHSLYCGITNDVDARINVHNAGKGAKYTRGRRPVELLGTTEKMTKSDALKFEIRIKKCPAGKKLSTLKKGIKTDGSR